MTRPPTIAQLRNLTDRAATGLSNDEQQRLRDGIARLAAAEQRAARLADLHARWIKAGAPPLGTSINRWWDIRLAELGAALQPAAHNDGPSVAECAADDRAHWTTKYDRP